MSRTSSGVARMSRLAISALTMTLLPEPVAPAIRRCGIFARSAARAWPATSRPSAKAMRDGIAATSGSSRIRRMATTLKSMFGISIPTTDLPGMGASIRMVRAASAIARSSASPSIRLTLTDGSGSTSYWVTTGPAFHFTTRLGMLKLASLPTMIAALRSWSMPRSELRAATSSRSVRGGRRYSRGSRGEGASLPSVTSSPASRGGTGARAGWSSSDGSAVATAAAAAAAQRHAAAGEDGGDLRGSLDGRRDLGTCGRLAGSVRVAHRTSLRGGRRGLSLSPRRVGGARGRIGRRGGDRGRDPARGPADGSHELAHGTVEGDDEAHHEEAGQDDERAGIAEEVAQGIRDETPEASSTSLLEEAGVGQERDHGQQGEVRDGEADHGSRPSGPGATGPLEVDARGR